MGEIIEEVIRGDYKYRLCRTRYGSSRYGACDICRNWADSVYIQFEMRRYFDPVNRRWSWTHAECETHMGHKECLIKIRRGTPVSIGRE